jgi:hypothetical protein
LGRLSFSRRTTSIKDKSLHARHYINKSIGTSAKRRFGRMVPVPPASKFQQKISSSRLLCIVGVNSFYHLQYPRACRKMRLSTNQSHRLICEVKAQNSRPQTYNPRPLRPLWFISQLRTQDPKLETLFPSLQRPLGSLRFISHRFEINFTLSSRDLVQQNEKITKDNRNNRWRIDHYCRGDLSI